MDQHISTSSDKKEPPTTFAALSLLLSLRGGFFL